MSVVRGMEKVISRSVFTLSNMAFVLQVILCLLQINRKLSILRFVLLTIPLFVYRSNVYRSLGIMVMILAYLCSTSGGGFSEFLWKRSGEISALPWRKDREDDCEKMQSSSDGDPYEDDVNKCLSCNHEYGGFPAAEDLNNEGSPFNPSSGGVPSRKHIRYRLCVLCGR